MAGNKKIELNSAWSFNLYGPKREGQKVERWTFFPVSFRRFRRKVGGLYRGCHRPFMHRSWLRLLTEDVSANTEASRARMKKKLCYQGTKVAKRWAFNVKQTLFQQYHANEHEMDISVSLYTPMHSVQKHAVSTHCLECIFHAMQRHDWNRSWLSSEITQNYRTEDQMWYAPKCLQHLEVDRLQNGFRLVEFYEQHDEYPVIR